jgi:hypothetical protein
MDTIKVKKYIGQRAKNVIKRYNEHKRSYSKNINVLFRKKLRWRHTYSRSLANFTPEKRSKTKYARTLSHP